jgi:hypothetical protein
MRRDEKEKRVNVSKNQWTRDKSERKVTVTFDGQTYATDNAEETIAI